MAEILADSAAMAKVARRHGANFQSELVTAKVVHRERNSISDNERDCRRPGKASCESDC